MPVRWCVIGATGLIGRRMVGEIIAADNCQLVGVSSRHEGAITALGGKLDVPGFTSVAQMLDQVHCDAVYLGSPQSDHLQHTRLAASRGRHVLCEKPLARSGREAEDLVEACQRAGVKLGTAFNQRFHNLHVKARQLVAEGVIGDVVSARCQYGQENPPDPDAWRQVAALSGGGCMVDIGTHAMDVVEFVTGKRFHRVMAAAHNVIHPYEVEDAMGALLEFEDGGFALVDSYYCTPIGLLRNDLEINGTKGTIYTVDVVRGGRMGGRLEVQAEGLQSTYEWDGSDMYREELVAFAKAILEDRDPPCSGLAGLHSQRLLDACYESARTGRIVDVL